MIVGGAPYGGANHPEAGHIRVPRAQGDERFAGICPFDGDCLEGLACGPAMKARWGVSPADLPDDYPAWEIEVDYIAALCTNLTYILRPDRIILGVGIMQRSHLTTSCALGSGTSWPLTTAASVTSISIPTSRNRQRDRPHVLQARSRWHID